jgi:hypothetical protein
MKELSLQDVMSELAEGVRVVLQVRHAERPKLDSDDPTFGENLPLTEEGVRTARVFGERLRGYTGEAKFISSPLLRTRMTARFIAEGMGREVGDIPVHAQLGNGTFYYGDSAELVKMFKQRNFFEYCFEYLEKGRQYALNDLAPATDALEDWLLSQASAPLTVATSHDFHIAAFLSARGAYTRHSQETWPHFLDAAALFVGRDGSRRYAFVRTGLSDGIVGVKPSSP